MKVLMLEQDGITLTVADYDREEYLRLREKAEGRRALAALASHYAVGIVGMLTQEWKCPIDWKFAPVSLKWAFYSKTEACWCLSRNEPVWNDLTADWESPNSFNLAMSELHGIPHSAAKFKRKGDKA